MVTLAWVIALMEEVRLMLKMPVGGVVWMLKLMLTISVAGRALASTMACRSEPVPWLPVLVTSSVDSTVRVSSSSTSKGRRRGFPEATGLLVRQDLGRNHLIVGSPGRIISRCTNGQDTVGRRSG